MNRRTVLRSAALGLVAGPALGQGQGGPFVGATATFDKAHQETLPPWAFTSQLILPPTPRPTKMGTFEDLDGKPFVFGPADAVPIGEVFHGIAREWGETPAHWSSFGCDLTKTSRADCWKEKHDHFGSVELYDTSKSIQNWAGLPIKCYKIPIIEIETLLREDAVRPALMYAYAGMVPGPTYKFRLGQPVVIRYENHLETELSVHLHGAHSPSHSDGFPNFYVLQEKSRDYFYPNILPRLFGQTGEVVTPDPEEAQSTMWYHDHGMDGTGYNVAKGLAGFALVYGERELQLIRDGVLPGLGDDSCKDPEIDQPSTDPTLEHPDFPGFYTPGKEPYHNPYELPLVLQDKVVDRATGQVSYDSDAHNGYLGDTFFVNGVAWPYKNVHNRKYRLRILNGSNSRFYRLRILSEADFRKSQADGLNAAELELRSKPYLRIGKDSWLWSKALRTKHIVLGMANRADLVVDFSKIQLDEDQRNIDGPGPRVYYLVNTMPQFDGRGPKAKLEDGGDPRVLPLPFNVPGKPLVELERPIALMKFIVNHDEAPPAVDASVEHDTMLIERTLIPDAKVTTVREFIFERGKGAWQVNGRFYDPTIANASPAIDTAEEWILRNGGGGWWHPIHIHLESHQIVRYQKDFVADGIVDPADAPALPLLQNLQDVTSFIPDPEAIGFHDTQILGPNTVVRIRIRFRTWSGPFVFHCHNLEHEDMRMMQNFETVPQTDPPTHDPNVAPAPRTHGNAVTLGTRVGELDWDYPPVPETPVREAREPLIPPRGPSTP